MNKKFFPIFLMFFPSLINFGNFLQKNKPSFPIIFPLPSKMNNFHYNYYFINCLKMLIKYICICVSSKITDIKNNIIIHFF